MPDKTPLDELVAAVETWQVKRVEEAAEFSSSGLQRFCEVMNYHTRRLISVTGKNDPEFWSALSELCVNAQTLTTKGAKLRANHIDRTQE